VLTQRREVGEGRKEKTVTIRSFAYFAASRELFCLFHTFEGPRPDPISRHISRKRLTAVRGWCTLPTERRDSHALRRGWSKPSCNGKQGPVLGGQGKPDAYNIRTRRRVRRCFNA